MTQPVSNRARHAYDDVSCVDPAATSTCDETPPSERVCRDVTAYLVPAPPPRAADTPIARRDEHGAASHPTFCQRADTVVEGFLCNDPTAVSNACRRPKNDFDAYVCDEPRMRELQWFVIRETWSLIKSLVGVLGGRSAGGSGSGSGPQSGKP